MSHNNHHAVESLEYKVTFCGLQEWYKAMFEKLGWMILAERDGRHHKIAQYKEGILHLNEAIIEKIHETEDSDKKQDLKILHFNVVSLIEHVNKYLGSDMPMVERRLRTSSKKSRRNTIKGHGKK
jgi:hypothetical protein